MMRAITVLRMTYWLAALILILFWLVVLILVYHILSNIGHYDRWEGIVYLILSLLGVESVLLALRKSFWGRLLLFPLGLIVAAPFFFGYSFEQSVHEFDGRSGFHREALLSLLIGFSLVLVHLWLAAYPTLEAKLTKQSTPPHEPPAP